MGLAQVVCLHWWHICEAFKDSTECRSIVFWKHSGHLYSTFLPTIYFIWHTSHQNIKHINRKQTNTLSGLLRSDDFIFIYSILQQNERPNYILMLFVFCRTVAQQQLMAKLPSRMTVRSKSWQWVITQRRVRESLLWAALSHRVNRICASPCSRKVHSVFKKGSVTASSIAQPRVRVYTHGTLIHCCGVQVGGWNCK